MRLLAASLLFIFAASAQCAEGPPSVVTARAVLATNAVHPGKAGKLAVVAHVRRGYHINDHDPSLDYLIPTKVKFANSKDVQIEKVVYPHGTLKKFVFLDSPISVYQGEFSVRSIVRASRSAKPGTYVLQGKLTYQACNDHACLPPTSVPLKISVPVVSTSIPLKPANLEVFRKINFK